MSQFIYTQALSNYLFTNLTTDVIKAVLVYTGTGHYVPSQSTDQYLSAIASGDRVATTAALADKTFNGIDFWAAVATLGVVPAGPAAQAIVVYVDTGNAATSTLLMYTDEYANLPVTPDGLREIKITWPNVGMFSLPSAELNATCIVAGALSVDRYSVGMGQTYYLDSSRTDTYTSDGTMTRPYKTFNALAAALPSTGLVHVVMAPSTGYTSTGGTVNCDFILHANQSTLTVTSGTITINGLSVIYDLITSGSVVYAYAGTARARRTGGSLSGAMTISGGFPHLKDLNASNVITVSAGTPFFDTLTGGARVVGSGASAYVFAQNVNINSSATSPSFDVSGGGILNVRGASVISNSAIAINAAGSATSSAPNILLDIIANGVISCGSAYTYWSRILPAPTGTNLHGLPTGIDVASAAILGSDSTGRIVSSTPASTALSDTAALVRWGSVPAGSTSTGTANTLALDASYLYVCVASGNWKRIPLTR
jgi:hypothetical protein